MTAAGVGDASEAGGTLPDAEKDAGGGTAGAGGGGTLPDVESGAGAAAAGAGEGITGAPE